MAAKDTAAAARVADVTATVTTSMASGHPPQGQGVLRLVPQCLVKLSRGLTGHRVG
eukprot:CAMPEP_0183497732 /NCGR_PEP_ID=MMETSP0371-20130417/157_1 /TAXON_ID=268820 /ORGANISM="Peridinium aciculiferum, Strain PAER-2" /LENGTH=55 /DNA_ID=CAMNT_0025691107 /DNA_START=7 /DNA_END=171 /DNA_ORIENTATION=+